MNEFDLAQRLIQHLDKGAAQISPEQAGRLYAMRQQALAQIPATQLQLTTATSHGQGHSLFHPRDGQVPPFMRMMLVTLLVALTIFMLGDWSGDNDEDNGQLDAKLLSSEISPQTFAQKDFGAWLQETR